MPYEVRRDFIGYGANPPDPKWPNGARLAINFVLNYEEGSEPSVQDGEGHTDIGLTEAHGMGQAIQGRDLAGESLFEYGSRVGFWRIMRLFRERGLPMTMYGCGLAFKRNPEASAAIKAAGHDVCSHGWRWIKHYELIEQEEREHIRKAIVSTEEMIGEPAWLALPLWTGREHAPAAGQEGGFLYDSDYWHGFVLGHGRRQAAARRAYSLTNNDGNYLTGSATPTSGSPSCATPSTCSTARARRSQDDVDRHACPCSAIPPRLGTGAAARLSRQAQGVWIPARRIAAIGATPSLSGKGLNE
jgi:peptidoglycan/xylan/chitin deacetylase (PgdA/CDA1 family)